MKVLVVGAGATGGYFGARLAVAGADVSFLLRARRAAEIRDNGLRMVGQGPDETIPVPVVTADQITDPYGLVLLTVKNQALEKALEDIAPAMGPGTLIVPFQNGMSHLDLLNDRFGPAAVLGGVVKISTTVDDQGRVVRLTPWASLAIGVQPGQHVDLTATTRVLDVDGYDLTVASDIVAEMWAKWVMIASVGALTCLMRGTVGEVVAVPGGRDAALAIIDEAAATAAVCGFPLASAEREGLTALLTQTGSPFASSMYRDLNAGASTEVQSILADMVDRAHAHGLDTPTLSLATTQLRVYEQRRLELASDR